MFPDEPVWSAALAALTATHVEEEDLNALIERGNVAVQAGIEMVAVIAYIGASLRSEALPEQAVQLHLRAASSAWESAAAVPHSARPR